MGAPTYASSRNIFQPLCFATDRFDNLFCTDGLGSPLRWDGITSAAEVAGLIAPTTAPTITPASGGAATAGDYVFGYRYLDDTLPNGIPSSLSPVVTVALTANQKGNWSALATSTQSRTKYVELWRSTSGEAITLYLVVRLGHNGSISTVTNSGGNNLVTTSAAHNLSTGAVITIASVTGGSNINGSRTVTVVSATTFTIGTVYSADGAGGTWQLTGFTADTASDATISASTNTSMAILQPNGQLNARRFEPPPNHTPYMVYHGDRMWYIGRVEYTKGTVATNGSTTLTGTSTDWTSAMDERYIIIDGEPAPIRISAIGGATSITLATAATTTASGKSYTIVPDPELRNTVFFSEENEAESVPSVNTVTIQNNTGDNDEITGGLSYGSSLYILKQRHVVDLHYVTQPNIDANPMTVSDRGAFTQRCAVVLDGAAYLMDQFGPWKFTGRGFEPIGAPVENLFREGTIDLANSKWFFISVNREKHLVIFHVGYTADSSTRPKRALVYNTALETWTYDSYIWELGGWAQLTVAGRQRSFLGAENDLVLVTEEGLTDLVAAVTGTATSATSSTLTDSTANFAATVIDAPVVIRAGTGKGQIRRISARTATQLTVSSNWTTTPDSTSVYVVGGIPWSHTSPLFQVPRTEQMDKRSLRLPFEPTTSNCSLDVKLYRNHETSALTHTTPYNGGNGVSVEAGANHAVFDLKAAQSDYGTTPGFKEYSFHGLRDDRGNAPLWFSIGLEGVQGQDQVTLYPYEIDGVQ